MKVCGLPAVGRLRLAFALRRLGRTVSTAAQGRGGGHRTNPPFVASEAEVALAAALLADARLPVSGSGGAGEGKAEVADGSPAYVVGGVRAELAVVEGIVAATDGSKEEEADRSVDGDSGGGGRCHGGAVADWSDVGLPSAGYGYKAAGAWWELSVEFRPSAASRLGSIAAVVVVVVAGVSSASLGRGCQSRSWRAHTGRQRAVGRGG
jgi:hypothetical protein